MKTKLHTALLYPLILIFSSFLKGKKTEYTNFFIDTKSEFKKEEVLEVISKENSFYDNIKYFFNKYSPLYDTTFIDFELNFTHAPEEKKYFSFDFPRVLNIFYTLSMLSARVPNGNINVGFTIKKHKLESQEINHFLRYILFVFASKKVDKLYIDKEALQDEQSNLAYETIIFYLNNATILNFSNAKNLYVLTCKKGKDTFDIIWSSSQDIELTDFNKVYDKYGKLLTKDIKISNSPIYAFHK